jgi:EAL domain-containing protein (putative c-di-GMP-specific phosphodiesterase class I)
MFAEPFAVNGNLIHTSASIGVSTTADAADSSDLLRQADLALYVAKGEGKGRWRRYQSALHTRIVERLALRSELDRAIADDALALSYQPIISLERGRTVSFEALVRWHHPTRGLILPTQFIDVAEESGLIVPMGNWVLANALRAAAEWRDVVANSQPAESNVFDGPPYVSVNVSARQFRTAGFPDRVHQELAEAGLPPSALMLEITESLFLHDDDQVWADLAALREAGIRIAIDDFGTGYSSLSYLRQVPVDVVKVDRSFINAMSTSTQQRALVEGIVRLADTLGLDVIAEGIERSADRDLLASIGCDFGQGYLFSEPLTEKDAITWLTNDRE